MGINQHNSEWTNEIEKRLVELRNSGMTFDEVTQHLNQEFNFKVPRTVARVKAKYYRIKDKNFDDIQAEVNYKETVEILEDGTHKSDKLLRMNAEQSKSPEYLLKAHGYDIDQWTLVSARNNIWNVYSKQDGIQTLYSSKITVRPKKDEFDFNKLIEAIESREPKEPIQYKGEPHQEPTYLEIPLFDLHFGIADLNYYENTLQEILHLLQKPYEEVLIIVGQDLFHNDNFKGTTANGTVIDKVDMVKAIDDAERFYEPIIDEALRNSKQVTVAYNKGNHDESISYMFVRGLRNLYRNQPNIRFDIEFKERKAFMLGLNFIGTTHGDKNRNNLAANFSVEFPLMWSKATTREVHIGHLHRKRATRKGHEIINDQDGLIVRELGTGNKIDQYHEDNGFNLAHKEFEIFEYTKTRKKRIHYV